MASVQSFPGQPRYYSASSEGCQSTHKYRVIDESRREQAIACGLRRRHFFSHTFRYLPKCGPDALRLSARMCNVRDLDAQWELVLHAAETALHGIDSRLFFDDEVVWHQQQFGLPGHVATANLVVQGVHLYTFVHISDVVQRISRRRSHKTQIEKRLKGWHHMLLNAICNFALEFGCCEILVPTPELAMRHTARWRRVEPQLFERVYGENVRSRYVAERRGSWWTIDPERNRDRILIGEKAEHGGEKRHSISVCHDIEAGYGHRAVDPALARRADRQFPRVVEEMLEIEQRAGLRATYNLVGRLASRVRPQIAAAGHSVAFHSYDHRIDRPSRVGAAVSRASRALLGWPARPPSETALYQLRRCRTVDYRLKGYRAPQSRLTSELTAANLCHYNFEWLASSAKSLRLSIPVVRDRLVYIPIHFDDWAMYRGRMRYEGWERKALAAIAAGDRVAFSLHDCYADWWLPSYAVFLKKLQGLAVFRTLDELAADAYLAAGA